jgi:hypothetical protein
VVNRHTLGDPAAKHRAVRRRGTTGACPRNPVTRAGINMPVVTRFRSEKTRDAVDDIAMASPAPFCRAPLQGSDKHRD